MRKRTTPKAEIEASADPVAAAASPEPGSPIQQLIQKLSSPRAVERERARSELVALGERVVPELLDAFGVADERVRLEACKALTEIAEPSSIPTLIQCLEDEHQDLRWVAAEGLLNIGGPAVEPLLLALIDRAWAHTILDGDLHVLRGWSRRASEPIFEPLHLALRAPEPGVSVPLAAEALLLNWRKSTEPAAGGRPHPVSRELEPRKDKAWYDRRL